MSVHPAKALQIEAAIQRQEDHKNWCRRQHALGLLSSISTDIAMADFYIAQLKEQLNAGST